MAYVEAIDFDFAAFWRNALSLFRTTVIQGIMPNYLRYRLKGGCYFITVNLLKGKYVAG
ncbi:hypothetical protein SAMN05216302_101842 [Nitrosomonas aestuarii]|uniref:Uncharacterized protein n=1 Tax=Nitrosomonas aestuarii TaxID=52441 RepID=A0A1I4D514_9PROT|nr:hypothetical protein SAMN05216302_101842 [Nitrosomonas aestuarii]